MPVRADPLGSNLNYNYQHVPYISSPLIWLLRTSGREHYASMCKLVGTMYSTGDRKTPDLSRQVNETMLVGSERFLERMLGVSSGNGREQVV